MLSSMRVLYVEDDEDIRLLMERRIASLAQACILARDGREGLDLFHQHKPDIVVSDLQMPGMDGLALAAAIKAEAPETPIILTTAHSDADYLLKAIELGVDGYVVKPIKLPMLQGVLEKCANALYMRREVERQHRELQRLYEEDQEDQAVANSIWRKLLRESGPKDPAVDVYVQPTREFSGDFIAAARGPNGDLYTMLADVTGHGLQAAIFLLPISHLFYAGVKAGVSVSELARTLNDAMRDFGVMGKFIAAAIARIDFHNKTLDVWNGGSHAYFIHHNGRSVHAFDSRHFPLGIAGPETFTSDTEHLSCEMPGTLFMCSDGVSEAEGDSGEQFGTERALAVLADDPRQGRERLLASLQTHLAGRMPHDDISFILVDCSDTAPRP